MTEVERHSYDVVVIGAGGAGLRAVIEARERGLKVAVVSKSLFGKAHTVMAEGGCAAAMGNTNPKDNWKTHFGDTQISDLRRPFTCVSTDLTTGGMHIHRRGSLRRERCGRIARA